MIALDGTILALCGAILITALTLWRAHRNPLVKFDLLDLLMEGGKVSKIAVAFMLVLGVSTWVIIHLTIHGKMTENYLTIYTGAWIIPLVTKVVSNRSEQLTGAKDANSTAG